MRKTLLTASDMLTALLVAPVVAMCAIFCAVAVATLGAILAIPLLNAFGSRGGLVIAVALIGVIAIRSGELAFDSTLTYLKYEREKICADQPTDTVTYRMVSADLNPRLAHPASSMDAWICGFAVCAFGAGAGLVFFLGGARPFLADDALTIGEVMLPMVGVTGFFYFAGFATHASEGE
jgi:hypothetical protein